MTTSCGLSRVFIGTEGAQMLDARVATKTSTIC
jgi:hypothetical protein